MGGWWSAIYFSVYVIINALVILSLFVGVICMGKVSETKATRSKAPIFPWKSTEERMQSEVKRGKVKLSRNFTLTSCFPILKVSEMFRLRNVQSLSGTRRKQNGNHQGNEHQVSRGRSE